jgi:hypothetical protein
VEDVSLIDGKGSRQLDFVVIRFVSRLQLQLWIGAK